MQDTCNKIKFVTPSNQNTLEDKGILLHLRGAGESFPHGFEKFFKAFKDSKIKLEDSKTKLKIKEVLFM